MSAGHVSIMLRNVLIIAYLVVGVIVASSHHYFSHVSGLMGLLSAVLAVLLWPLILLGVNLHLK